MWFWSYHQFRSLCGTDMRGENCFFFKSSIPFALAPLGREWQRYFFPSCLHIHTNTHDSLKTITKLPLQVYTTLHIICTVFASLIWAVNYFESPASKYIFASNVCTYMHKKEKKTAYKGWKHPTQQFSFAQESAHSGPELRQIQTSPATMYSDLVWEETIPRV